MYLFYFTLVIIPCCVMMSPSVMKQMTEHIPFFEDFCKGIKAGDTCENLVGYSAVYRVCFGMACFFFVFCVLTFKVNNSKSCRASIHNGFWFFKLLLLGAMCSGAFFIPDQETFLNVWRYVGAVGSFFFICIQLLLIVEFAHKWNKNWTAGTVRNKLWYASLSLATLIMYSIAVGGLALMAVFYTQWDDCMDNKILLGVHGGLCVLISLAAISPCVQNRQPHSGLLQPGLISCYVTYLTFSALTSKPEKVVKDEHGKNVTICVPDFGQDFRRDESMVTWLGTLLLVVCISYSCLTSTTRSSSDALQRRYGAPELEVARCCFCFGPDGEATKTPPLRPSSLGAGPSSGSRWPPVGCVCCCTCGPWWLPFAVLPGSSLSEDVQVPHSSAGLCPLWRAAPGTCAPGVKQQLVPCAKLTSPGLIKPDKTPSPDELLTVKSKRKQTTSLLYRN